MKKLIFSISLFLISLISNAQITFQKTFNASTVGYGFCVKQTADGGYVITGKNDDISSSADVYLTKTDNNGNLIWTKTYGGSFSAEGRFVQQTTDGGYIITGGITTNLDPDPDVYLIKTDSIGSLVWAKSYGGANYDFGLSVQQAVDGGYLVVGVTYSTGGGDVYLIKTDINGDTLWTKTIGITTGTECGYSVKQTSDGGYIISGVYNSNGIIDGDFYLIKTDVNGDTLWTRTFGGTGRDYALSVQQTTDGGYIMGGYTTSFGAGDYDAYIVKTDSSGNATWTKTFGGTNTDHGQSVQQTTDGGYIIVGTTRSFGAGIWDAYLIKTDGSGNSLWTKAFGDTDSDEGRFVQQTSDGGYIIVGSTSSFSSGISDVYLIKTAANGISGCNESPATTTINSPSTQATNPAAIVSSSSTIIANPNTAVSTGGIVNTLCTTVSINEITVDNSFSISPNPSAGIFIISFGKTILKSNIEILNTLGESVFTENIFNESKKEINLKNISDGIYFVKVSDGEKSSCKKLIIEHD